MTFIIHILTALKRFHIKRTTQCLKKLLNQRFILISKLIAGHKQKNVWQTHTIQNLINLSCGPAKNRIEN